MNQKVERRVDLEGPGEFEVSPGSVFKVEGFASVRTADGGMHFSLIDGSNYAAPFSAADSPSWIVRVPEKGKVALTFRVDPDFEGELCRKVVAAAVVANDPDVEGPREGVAEALTGAGVGAGADKKAGEVPEYGLHPEWTDMG
ncbi:hypothetical protein HY605_06210 [Candidatus Peregrinibacteria bacterium]|nr:hypothetical protein [Candidatus Peregrinibacteria bacterium]